MARLVPPSERGAALLTVLLIVAVVSVLAATGLERLNLSIRLAANAASVSQARGYAVAAEDVALIRIDDQLARQKTELTLPPELNGQSFPVPLPSGIATATVTDGGNCFNLNGLVQKSSDGGYTANPPAIAQFARLMVLIGIGAQDAAAVSASATDWIDSDTTPLPGGAEDEVYTQQRPAYRAANTLMASPSELRAVAGVTPALYARLRPFVCALPMAELPLIDVNTLTPEQAPLIAMLLDRMTVEQARAALAARPPQGFESPTAFWALPALSGTTGGPATIGRTSVSTRWFRLGIDVTMPGATFHQTSLIDARQPPARLVARSWGAES